MDFLIADTFTESLARLTGEEQKLAKTTAFDLQLDPSSPGLRFHKLDKAKDKKFWSVRVSDNLRLIVHRTSDSLLLCYVDHHDKAYSWAERRKLETHPTTGAAQLVEIRESVRKIVVPAYVQAPVDEKTAQNAPASDAPARALSTKSKEKRAPATLPLFAALSDSELLAYGVPPEWTSSVREATEDSILVLADHLPAEAAEALLELANGGTPRPRPPAPPIAAVDPFQHPDAQRRFRIVTNREELERALDAPWERWAVFLHPVQRELVERRFAGPARIAGSAGTGKTVVALHRAVHLARANPDARVLLTTFSGALANALRSKVLLLIGTEPRLRERVDVESLEGFARRLHERTLGKAAIATQETVRDLLRDAAAKSPELKATLAFLVSEWREVVDAWQLDSWEAYRDVARLGRKTRLPEKQRRALWDVFERVGAGLVERKQVTLSDIYRRLSESMATTGKRPYDCVVVDEAQDVSVAQLRFVSVLGAGRPDGLFFAGDLGQRIFQLPFSWKALGVDVRGRSGTLRINYRTSHQIRAQADRLLPGKVADVDGNIEERGRTVSVFNGPPPTIQTFTSADAETEAVGAWLAGRTNDGLVPHEIAIFVRSEAELDRARRGATKGGLSFTVLDEHLATAKGHVALATMHLAKGLEFRAVVVMACDDEIIPLQSRIAGVTDEGDLEEVYETERHLLYVACTRARDQLLVTGVEPASEFLDDMRSAPGPAAPSANA